ncbi:hypothetical protein GH714_026334 [Hevea brasiliensis]|uniref:USP domain-containing protein n=1 Tax=Hevea brasiliensis TaxID=3981 RepID=A0A6A6LE39_HEVBR|nr:hypothetical protein GH714_026334 [Hevea brasiliensis]
MHVTGDLGFSSLVLLLCVVLPVIAFVIRRKWRLSVARQEEIKRLLILASEEAARAELEATVSSGKCQIIHWRQGHKEECCPSNATYYVNDDGGNSSRNVAKEKQYDIYGGRNGHARIKTSSVGHVLYKTGGNQGVPHVKGDVFEVDSFANTEGTSSTSESLGTSFSGFSTSSVGGESSDDVSFGESISSNDVSINKSISSNEPRSDGQISSDTVPDVLESGLKRVDHAEPLSPKFASLIDSVDSFNKFSKLNKSISRSNDGESQCASTDITGLSINTMHNGSITQPGKVSSGFWDRNLDSVVTSNVVHDDPDLSSSREGANINSESFLHFKFDLSGRKVPSSNVQSSEVKGIRSDNAHRAISEISSPVDRAVLSEDTCDGIPKARRSTSVSCEKSGHMDNESSHESNVSKPTEHKSVPSSFHMLIYLQVVEDTVSTSHVSKSRVSSSASETHLASRDNGHSVPSVKSGKIDNVEADAVTASPTISGLKSSVRKVVDQLRGPRCGKYNDKGLFSYDLFVKLYTSNKVEMRPCGLINCGNRYSIDAMQSVCLKEAGVNALGSFEEETTLIGLTFGGYLHSKIRCMKCHYKSERHERMMDLTVEIEGDIGKLEDALRQFTGTEILDGDNKYQCSRCKSYERAKKKLTILEAPNVLTIALKRFQSGKFGKLNKSIRFPEILDLAPYMSGTSDKSPIYRLYGVVVHQDNMNASFSGHYVCYVKNIQNKWFKIDDSTVTPVEIGRVLTEGAYMLLYARCSPRAPRLIRNRIVSPDPRMKGSPSRIIEKNAALNSRSTSTRSSVFQLHPNSIPPDSLASVESFYLKFHRLQRILEEDSSSDNYSFTSSNSDEGSCSTESTRDSTSTDDLSDYIFGGWNNSWRNTSDSDTCSSSSSSPLYSRHSPETSRSRTDFADSAMEGGDWDRVPSGSSRVVDLAAKEGDHFLPCDSSKQCRNLGSSNNVSSSRETDSAKLVWVNPVKSGVSFRRSMSKRTD